MLIKNTELLPCKEINGMCPYKERDKDTLEKEVIIKIGLRPGDFDDSFLHILIYLKDMIEPEDYLAFHMVRIPTKDLPDADQWSLNGDLKSSDYKILEDVLIKANLEDMAKNLAKNAGNKALKGEKILVKDLHPYC